MSESNPFIRALFRPVVPVLLLGSLTFHSLQAQNEGADSGKERCTRNLNAIYKAIQAYRADHKDIPGWLSDLVPKYLTDPNLLVCPNSKESGQVVNFGLADPKLSTSYIYEFCDVAIPKTFSGGVDRTMKEWKMRQMEIVGPRIPMVRCHQHKQVLNLSFEGKIYESSGSWEQDLKDVSSAELMPGTIFAAVIRDSAQKATPQSLEIPERDPKAKTNLIDLTTHYNAALTEGWHRQDPADTNPHNDLSWMPRGTQKFAGVEFDARGVIQLASRKMTTPRYPKAVRGIKVGRKTPQVHFLQSTGWSAGEGTPIASFVFNYANGEKRQFTVLYGVHVLDWVVPGQPVDKKNSVLAWAGKSPVTEQQGTELRIYKTVWKNPLPDETIETIDYISSMNDPAPFLIAITTE